MSLTLFDFFTVPEIWKFRLQDGLKADPFGSVLFYGRYWFDIEEVV